MIKIARINSTRGSSASSADMTARVEELERSVQNMQEQLSETQERLDFAERLLAKGREERR